MEDPMSLNIAVRIERLDDADALCTGVLGLEDRPQDPDLVNPDSGRLDAS